MDITEVQEKELLTDRFTKRYSSVNSLITFLIATDDYITVGDILDVVNNQGQFEYLDDADIEMVVGFDKPASDNQVLFALVDLESWGLIENIKTMEDGVEVTYIRWGTNDKGELPTVAE
jgi:hypothetical protein